ncbi:unnamed protein product, partial [Candidula unifasciata]
KAKQLRGKKKEELLKQLDDLKKGIYTVRKSVARVLTVIKQTQKDNLYKCYRKKTHKLKDLHQKKTRALRRALTPYELSLKSKKELRQQKLYPLRKYAVKE